MIIDVRQVPEGLSHVDGETALELYDEELPPLARPVKCGVDLDRMGDVITARLSYDAALNMQCARCLEEYEMPVRGNALFFIKPESERAAGVGDDECPDFFFGERDQSVDVGSVIYDDIMTALPLKPLCAENCEGIEYGSNDSGSKDEDTIDPRWAALGKIKIRNSECGMRN